MTQTEHAQYVRASKQIAQFCGTMALSLITIVAIASAASAVVAYALLFVGAHPFGAVLFGMFLGSFGSMPIWGPAFLYISDRFGPEYPVY